MQKELDGELGTLVLKHERRVNETLDAKSRELLLTAIQRYHRLTQPIQPPAASIFLTTI